MTLTASPSVGYELSAISAKNHSTNANISLSGSGNTRTFTMPAADVDVTATFSTLPSYAITVTDGSADPTPATQGQTVTVTPIVPDGKVLDSSNPYTVTPTLTLTSNGNGGYTFTMPNQAVSVTFNFVDAPDYLFYETFDKFSGTGGNDGSWSGTIASTGWGTTDESDWVQSNGNSAYKCAKLGSGSKKGSAQTRSIAVTNGSAYMLTFKAAAWDGGSEYTQLNISAVGAILYSDASCTMPISSETLVKGAWTTYTVYAKATSASMSIKFEANNTSNNRFFLDDVKVEPQREPDYTVTIESGITNGTVTADKAKADENDLVTLTVTPDAGYAIGTVSYTPEGGSATTITPVNGVYSFTMPDANVTVSATFTAIHYTINLDVQPAAASTAGCTIPLPSQASVFLEDDVSKSTVGQKVTFRMHTETGWVVPSGYLPTVSYSGGTCTVTRENTDTDGATFSFTMPAADVTIRATFAEYVAPLWLLGNNLEGEMSYSGGTPFTYADGNYTLTTYFKGNNFDNGVWFGAFTLSKKNDANSWDDLNESGKRIGPKDGNNVVINASYPTKDLSVNTNSFWIPAGIYTITVNKACTSVTITPITGYGVTLSPNGGNVETGSSVTASETLSAALKAINSDLSDNCATLALSLDGGNTFVNGASHEFSNSDEGPKSVVGKATYGHIEAISAPASFTVTKADNSNKYQLVTSTAGLTPNKKVWNI